MGTVISIDAASTAAAAKQRRAQQDARALLLSAAVEAGDSVTAINMLAGMLAAEHPGDEPVERVVAFLSTIAKEQAIAIAMSKAGIVWRRCVEMARDVMQTWPGSTPDVVEAAHGLLTMHVATGRLSLTASVDEIAIAVGEAWERAQ